MDMRQGGKARGFLRRSTTVMNGFLSFVDPEISVKMLCIIQFGL